MTDLPFRLIFTTCPDAAVAENIARTLVDEHLAGCVNILPAVQSVYTWHGKTETESEYLLIIKATEDHYAPIQERIRALHPYELPEILAVGLTEGLPAYLTWLNNPGNPP